MSFKRLLKTKPRHRVARLLTGVKLSHTNDDIDNATGLPTLRVLEPVNLSNAAFDFILKYPYRWTIELWVEDHDATRNTTVVDTDRCQLNELTEFIQQQRTQQHLELDHAIARQGWTATNYL